MQDVCGPPAVLAGADADRRWGWGLGCTRAGCTSRALFLLGGLNQQYRSRIGRGAAASLPQLRFKSVQPCSTPPPCSTAGLAADMAAAAAKGGPNAAMTAFDDNLDRVVST